MEYITKEMPKRLSHTKISQYSSIFSIANIFGISSISSIANNFLYYSFLLYNAQKSLIHTKQWAKNTQGVNSTEIKDKTGS